MATAGEGAAAARELGHGWKLSPCITVPGNTTVTLADIAGSGAISLYIWTTVAPKYWRALILRIYCRMKKRLLWKSRWAISSAWAA